MSVSRLMLVEDEAVVLRSVQELQASPAQAGTLSGLLQICMHCKKIRDEEGCWTAVERYVSSRSRAQFSHGICDQCVQTGEVMAPRRLMIVEDESLVALDLKDRLQDMGYVVVAQAADGRQAVEEARRTTPDLVLMDIRLGHGPDGVEAADIVRRELELPVVFLTAHSDEATLNRAKVAEPFGYVLKPVRDRELHIAIEMALYKHEAEKVMRESREWFAAILRSVGNAVIANDKHGAISFMNVAAETLTGWREDEARGRPLAEVLRLLRGKDA